jgi:hypothetical protein
MSAEPREALDKLREGSKIIAHGGRCFLTPLDCRAILEERAVLAERVSTLAALARDARNTAAAPDYDEQAIAEALWAVVDAALAGLGADPATQETPDA